MNRYFSKDSIIMAEKHIGNAHWPSEKCKSKPQCDIISCSLGCQLLKTSKQKQQKIMIVGKDVKN